MQRGESIVGVKVKSQMKKISFVGLKEFKNKFNSCRTIIVGGGEWGAIEDFLSVLTDYWFK